MAEAPADEAVRVSSEREIAARCVAILLKDDAVARGHYARVPGSLF